jgi:hypothetical protein
VGKWNRLRFPRRHGRRFFHSSSSAEPHFIWPAHHIRTRHTPILTASGSSCRSFRCARWPAARLSIGRIRVRRTRRF